MAFYGNLVGQLAQLLGQRDQQLAAVGVQLRGLPLSKKVPDADSRSSICRPSAVTVISMWLLSFSNTGLPPSGAEPGS
jgi:hypothetical protein